MLSIYITSLLALMVLVTYDVWLLHVLDWIHRWALRVWSFLERKKEAIDRRIKEEESDTL